MDLLGSGSFTCKEIFALPQWMDEHAAMFASKRYNLYKDFELEKISALSTPRSVGGLC
ncbi:MAG: hypothetical protein R2765_07935 [Ferruginibacter sp.]